MRAAAAFLLLIMPAPGEQEQEQESFLQLEGDRVVVKATGDLSLAGLLVAAEPLLDIEVLGKEKAGRANLEHPPFVRIPKDRLWSRVQLTASRRGFLLVETRAAGAGARAQYRLIDSEERDDPVPLSIAPDLVPVVSTHELKEKRDHWSRQHALLIRTVFDVGELEPSDFAEAMKVMTGRGLQQVAALPESGKVIAVLTAPQAVIWAHLAESLSDPQVWPAVRFRRFDLRHLSAFEAERLVNELLAKRNPPVDEPGLRRRREVVMQVPGKEAVVVRADVRVLEEIDRLIALADR